MPSATRDLDVIVVGAGFGGCYLLHLLRKEGFNVKVLEAGSTIGGVWCWNRYPGARVDCEFPYYGFSDPAIWKTFRWTERFPNDKELRTYFQHVATVWDLHKDIELNTQVTEAKYDEGKHRWRVSTAKGESLDCRWLIAATGTSFKHHIPEWKGREFFEGVIHHSAHWPDHVPLEGKRVAVIGAGSTGVQVVQESAKVGSQVTQFIRTPNYAIPMRQRKITEDDIFAHMAHMPHVFRACRANPAGLPVENSGLKTFDESPEARAARLELGWKQGGFNWTRGSYTDYIVDPQANREIYDFWAKKIRGRINDPRKRDLLAPLEPPYYIATKRPSLEQDYYECCDQDNVDITNSPIVEFTKTGIVTEDGTHRDFDIVAICTGFDAVTGGLRTMGIKGRKGIDLDEKWKDGVITHLGMLVNGFPNFFMVYGPQAPTSLTNGPPFIEIQCEYILQVLTKQREQNLATVEAKVEAEQAWREHVLGLADRTLLTQTNSWYMGANIPGKRREYLIYLGGIPMYKQKLDEALSDWQGYQTGHAGEER